MSDFEVTFRGKTVAAVRQMALDFVATSRAAEQADRRSGDQPIQEMLETLREEMKKQGLRVNVVPMTASVNTEAEVPGPAPDGPAPSPDTRVGDYGFSARCQGVLGKHFERAPDATLRDIATLGRDVIAGTKGAGAKVLAELDEVMNLVGLPWGSDQQASPEPERLPPAKESAPEEAETPRQHASLNFQEAVNKLRELANSGEQGLKQASTIGSGVLAEFGVPHASMIQDEEERARYARIVSEKLAELEDA